MGNGLRQGHEAVHTLTFLCSLCAIAGTLKKSMPVASAPLSLYLSLSLSQVSTTEIFLAALRLLFCDYEPLDRLAW